MSIDHPSPARGEGFRSAGCAGAVLRRALALALFGLCLPGAAGAAAENAGAPSVERGAYLVRAVAHCGECHTPRTALGGTDPSRALAGTPDGPESDPAPNITPHPETGIGGWSRADIVRVLKTGMLPDFDVVGSFMGEVVEQSTGRLTEDDLQAIAVYLESLPPIASPEATATQAGFGS